MEIGECDVRGYSVDSHDEKLQESKHGSDVWVFQCQLFECDDVPVCIAWEPQGMSARLYNSEVDEHSRTAPSENKR